MKKKLGNILRVVVTFGILAYLFHNIFSNEARSLTDRIAKSPDASVTELARDLDLEPVQIELIRARCVDEKTKTADINRLEWRERRQFVWDVGPRHLWKIFRSVVPGWFVAGVLCVGIVCALGIVRWQMILGVQGLELSLPRVTSVFFVGQFFNAFMLGSTGGDVIKAWYVAHETNHKKAEAVATVVVDRLIGLLALFVITLVMMGIYYHRVFDDPKMLGFAAFTLAVVVGTVLGTVLALRQGFVDKVPRLRAMLKRLPKYDMLERMVGAYRDYASHPAVLLKTTAISFCVHFFSMLSIVCIGKGLGIHTTNGNVDYFLYLPIINSLTALPVSLSGFGVREGMYALMFGEVGVALAPAVAMSLLGYVAGLFWSVVGAGFYLTHRKELPPAAVMAQSE